MALFSALLANMHSMRKGRFAGGVHPSRSDTWYMNTTITILTLTTSPPAWIKVWMSDLLKPMNALDAYMSLRFPYVGQSKFYKGNNTIQPSRDTFAQFDFQLSLALKRAIISSKTWCKRDAGNSIFNFRPFPAIDSNLKHLKAIYRQFQAYTAIYSHLQQCPAISSNFHQFTAIYSHFLKPFTTI